MKTGKELRIHVGLYGRCNVGKSSLLNLLTEASVALVSPVAGTTTDPVRKAYEVLGWGPVVWIDTAGMDHHTTPLGKQRSQRTLQTLQEVNLALVVCRTWGEVEMALVEQCEAAKIPFLVVWNRWEDSESESSLPYLPKQISPLQIHVISAHSSQQQDEKQRLLQAIQAAIPKTELLAPSLFEGCIQASDSVMLICPIDSAAPTGRLILPQVQALRELLDRQAMTVVLQPEQVAEYFKNPHHIKLVVVDSQLFGAIEPHIPAGVELTSFSILLAAAKGDLEIYKKGLLAIDQLSEGARILVVEHCTHQHSCEDIGRVKIPQKICKKVGQALDFRFLSSREAIPENLSEYALVIQCGGCMVGRVQVMRWIEACIKTGVPITNYGLLLQYLGQPTQQ